jgi:hypothetical protein
MGWQNILVKNHFLAWDLYAGNNFLPEPVLVAIPNIFVLIPHSAF